VYGEIRKAGVETIYKEISEYDGLDTFVDVGSGTGKICLHMSMISNFENIVGIEIVTGRHLYAIELQQNLGQDFDNVIFLNDDILKIEFERPCVVFTNDVSPCTCTMPLLFYLAAPAAAAAAGTG